MNTQPQATPLTTALLIAIVFLFSLGKSKAQEPRPEHQQADAAVNQLFENVVRNLETGYFDEKFRTEKLPAIVESLRGKAAKAKTLLQQRQVAHELLSRLPTSHAGLLSGESFARLICELTNKAIPGFGFQAINLDGMYFVGSVLEGGPADLAGLNPGDRILTVNGVAIADSKLLDWRTDDAYLPDPPTHQILCQRKNESVELLVDRGKGATESIKIASKVYSPFQAAKSSARIIEHEGTKIGYIHFWYIHTKGVPGLLKEKLEGDFADCDGLVLDLRGRGGSANEVRPIVNVLDGTDSNWSGKTVALVDRYSRSAKEYLAHLIKDEGVGRIVGHRTIGACVPVSFRNVGSNTIVMFPVGTLEGITEVIEEIGVTPDVLVESWRPFRGDNDPILNAGLKECKRMVSKQMASE